MLDISTGDAGPERDGPIATVLTELFELHRAMLHKLVTQDDETAAHVAEFLEDVANRYLDLSEEIQKNRAGYPHRLNSME